MTGTSLRGYMYEGDILSERDIFDGSTSVRGYNFEGESTALL